MRKKRGRWLAWPARVAIVMVLGPSLLTLGSRTVEADQEASGPAAAAPVTGSSGLLWGRLAVEEESPDGPWTPLHGVEVTLYPATRELLSDLERLRGSARDSPAQYETAVTRVRSALADHAARVEGVSMALASEEVVNRVRRQTSDPSGLFVFEALPAGDWLLVAVRLTAYPPRASGPGGGRSAPRPPDPRFLARTAEPAKEAEIWLTPVRLTAGEHLALSLTDRARWLTGPAP